MECPNATRNDFSTEKYQEDVMLQLCSTFLHDVEQIKIELATMRAKKWETCKQNFKNTELIAWKEILDHKLPPKRATKKLSASATIVIKTDTDQNGDAKRCATKKYGECNMICPSTRRLLP